ncbi:MAG TPA: M28 family peptidase [Gammaproteobacteria bacterium]|nr:M28 family peptidase [Gammaproteobacteria bacterium]
MPLSLHDYHDSSIRDDTTAVVTGRAAPAAAADTTRTDLPGRLARDIQRLAADIGERNVWRPAALQAAAGYIRDEWTAQGYSVREQSYEVGGLRCANLEVAVAGDDGGPVIVIGAHYDSVRGSPGADDNASGVATLLELSRLFAGTAHLRLRFVAFVNEEPPFFMTPLQGSEVYARQARRDGLDVELMVSLETLGYYSKQAWSQRYPPLVGRFYPPRGDFVAFVSNLRWFAKLRQFAKAFRASTQFPAEYLASPALIPGVSWSDHRAFWRQGYPALMVTDTAFYRFPYYHTPLDTADCVCCTELAEVTLGLAGAIRRFG